MGHRADSLYQRIYSVVWRIPKGRVATYGQVARLAGIPGHARQVGYALNALPDGTRVPWQRVINAQGRVSLRGSPGWEGYQQHLLEAEGVLFRPQTRFRVISVVDDPLNFRFLIELEEV